MIIPRLAPWEEGGQVGGTGWRYLQQTEKEQGVNRGQHDRPPSSGRSHAQILTNATHQPHLRPPSLLLFRNRQTPAILREVWKPGSHTERNDSYITKRVKLSRGTGIVVCEGSQLRCAQDAQKARSVEAGKEWAGSAFYETGEMAGLGSGLGRPIFAHQT